MSSNDPIGAAFRRQPPTRPEWLGKTVEETVNPSQEIVDPHHHLWDRPEVRYLLSDVLGDFSSGHKVIASVYAPCHSMYRANGPEEMKPVGEVEFVNGIAAQSASGNYGDARVCAGITGEIDLLCGSRIQPVLEAYMNAAGARFCGVRPTVCWHESAEVWAGGYQREILRQKEAVDAIRCLGKLSLSLDLFVFFTQVDEVLGICREFPELPIVLNHTGGLVGIGPLAGQREAVFPVWRSAMQSVARHSNVVMKLGGLGMRYAGFNFHQLAAAPSSDLLVEKWKPYIETCIELFGPERCMFESNFPVDRGSYSYHVLWNAFKKLSAHYSPDERNRLFRDTAITTYKLKLPSAGGGS